MATLSERGRRGGSKKSQRKAAAVRENGKRGGRPPKLQAGLLIPASQINNLVDIESDTELAVVMRHLFAHYRGETYTPPASVHNPVGLELAARGIIRDIENPR